MIFDNSQVPSRPIDEADSDLSQEREYEVNGVLVHIAPGDWVDVCESALEKDETYGISFQVVRTLDNYITILFDDDRDGIYHEISLTIDWILNNYRRIE
jgi:hypothetical protein